MKDREHKKDSLQHDAMQCDAMQLSAMQYSAMQSYSMQSDAFFNAHFKDIQGLFQSKETKIQKQKSHPVEMSDIAM